MQVETARQNLPAITLPDWILDWSVEAAVDGGGDEYVHVLLKVPEDFEPAPKVDELMQLQRRIREHLWSHGVTEWVSVSLTDDGDYTEDESDAADESDRPRPAATS